MIDPLLLKVRDVCVERYRLKQPEFLLRWAIALVRGGIPDAAVAPFNVHSVGIARKWVGGVKTDRICVRVTVLRKLPERDLARHGVPVIEREIEGVPIDVVEAGPLVVEAQAEQEGDRTAVQEFRPLRPGCSISRNNDLFGTLGALCKSRRPGEQGRIFALSCHHVLAGFSVPPVAKTIFQPGDSQAPQPDDRVSGGFTRGVETADPAAQPPAFTADAAIAELDASVSFDADYLGIGRSAGVLDMVHPDEDERTLLDDKHFIKFGRTTGLTEGTLDALRENLIAVVGGKPRAYNDQFLVRRLPNSGKPMSDPGDSGAMVFHKDSRRTAGLVIGSPLGPKNDEQTIVSPISAVLRELGIDLL